MKNKVLIIAAHPDDDILGCGGFMSRYKGLYEIKVLFVAEGSTCRFNEPNSDKARKEVLERKKMGINALNSLGVNEYKFNNFPCGRLDQVPLIEINKLIEDEIKVFKPKIVLTHSDVDSNKDHHKVLDSTIIATRPGSGVEQVMSYEVLSSTEWGFKKSFNPNFFLKLDKKNIKDKVKAFSFYKSEIKDSPYPRSKTAIQTLAKMRGVQSGNEYAEAYNLIRFNL